MKNSIKWIVIAVLLVAFIAGATVLYNKLSKEYDGNNLTEIPQGQVSSEATSSEVTSPETTNSEATSPETEKNFTVPDFTVLDNNGNKVNLSDYIGKPIVLNFWATWCYYCKVEMPHFDEAYEKYPDVQFLMVNATDGTRETVEKAKEYIEQEGYKFDVFYDTELDAVSAYYINAYPSTFFIDENGNLVTWRSGALDLQMLESGIEMITE